MPETTPNPILFYNDGTVRRYTMVGGYPVFYIASHHLPLCSSCVQENVKACQDVDSEHFVTGHGVNWECDSLYCDHCYQTIESAYGEPS